MLRVSVDWVFNLHYYYLHRVLLLTPLFGVDAMTPFLAQGAVHAIRDALSLGKALSAVPDASRSAAIKNLEPYQEEMLTRGRQAAANSKLAFAETTVPKMMFGRPVVTLPVDDLVL